MKYEIIKDGFECTLPDLIDQDRFQVIKTEIEGTWLIKKLPPMTIEATLSTTENSTGTSNVDLSKIN